MSLADTLVNVANEVAEHEELLSAIGEPLLELISEALDGGVPRAKLIEVIKAEMTAASKETMRKELGE